MSCKSALYAANTNSQTVAVNGVINFGSIVRRFGNNCNVSGGNVILIGPGYYDIDTNITFVAAAAGIASIALFKDGTAIHGAETSVTVTAGDTYSVNIPALIRELCCCESTITAVFTALGGTVTNAAVTVEKI